MRSESAENRTTRFAFVIHPYKKEHFLSHPWFSWARFLPLPVVEWICSWIPPVALGKVRAEWDGKRVSGYLIGLPDSHRVILTRSPEHTYRKIERAARWAEKRGAGIIGLGAFTSVVGDAGVTLAERLEIGVTTGNALATWASLETLKDAIERAGSDLKTSTIAILGATGAIGQAIARALSAEVSGLYLVSRTLQKLKELEKDLIARNPFLKVDVDVEARRELVAKCDALVSTTSSPAKPVIPVDYLAPGTIVVDIAQPPDFPEEVARTRADCLFLEAGEVLAPPGIRTDFALPLPKGVLYGCLAETMLLALEGKSEDFCVGRMISEEQVRWIGERARVHGFTRAPFTRFGKFITEEDFNRVRKIRGTRN
ncbi:MAG: hypothetical protein V2G44_03310 [bacterium JZ-2024 1]